MTNQKNMDCQDIQRLYEAVSALKNADECRAFFEDICTPGEIRAIAQRLEVAKALNDGKTFNDISAATGASTATISRVSRCLAHGSGGYGLILNQDK